MFKYAHDAGIIESYSEFLNLWQRRFSTPSNQLSIGVNSFRNYISNFLNSLRTDIKAFSNLPVKFFMQNVFQILSGYFSRAEFLLRIFKNVRIIKSCYALICGEEIPQRKKFILINLFGNLHRNAFCNLHSYILFKQILNICFNSSPPFRMESP